MSHTSETIDGIGGGETGNDRGLIETDGGDVRPPKPFYIVVGDEQGTVLEKLRTKLGKPLLSEPHRDRTKKHNWYLFKDGGGVRHDGGIDSGEGGRTFWWLGEGNSSLNHHFMIFKNPIIMVVINYRYAEKAPIEKLEEIYSMVVKELMEGDRHPNLRMMVVGYKFQKGLKSHRGYKKDVLQWVLSRQKEIEEDFCDYVEDWEL